MSDLQDRMRERWHDRRGKSTNWKKLVIMTLALIILIIVVAKLNQAENIKWNAKPDSTQTNADSTVGATQP